MQTIIGQIRNVIDDIDRRRQETEREESRKRCQQKIGIGNLVIEDQWNRDQNILEPLVHANGLENCQRCYFFQRQDLCIVGTAPAVGRSVRRHDDGAPRHIEDCQIIPAVA